MLSSIALLHVQQPRNVGPLEGATHLGQMGEPGEGPHVLIWLRLFEGVVTAAAYKTHGCPSSIASASMLCQLAVGRQPDQLEKLTAEDLILIMGGLPEGKEVYARMAVSALGKAFESPIG